MTFADPYAAVRRRARLPLLLAAAVVLVLGWLVAPRPVPLYDGVGTPDEPYRYVVPPANYRSTPPVTTATTDIQLEGGRSCCELEANSAEQGPQVALYIPRGGLAAAGDGTLTVQASPLAPAGPVPVAKGTFEGNVYRVTARGPSGPAQLTPDGSRATIQLRALSANSPGPTFWYRPVDSAPWRALPTGKAGFDIYESQFVGPGDYVLVRKGGTSGGSTLGVLLGILAIPALLIVALVVLRLRAGPRADEDEDEGMGAGDGGVAGDANGEDDRDDGEDDRDGGGSGARSRR